MRLNLRSLAFSLWLLFSGRSKAPEPDDHIFLRVVQAEAGFLNFLCDPGHVGHPPRDHDVVRLRQMGLVPSTRC